MAMNWIKGLVAPAADFGQGNPGQGPGGPPVGGGPSPYGVSGVPAPGSPPLAGAPDPGLSPMTWSTGTKTQAEAQGLPGGSLAADKRVAELEHDVKALALFARTLLTVLEEKNVFSREQFEATKKRLDLLDGKLDDR